MKGKRFLITLILILFISCGEKDSHEKKNLEKVVILEKDLKNEPQKNITKEKKDNKEEKNKEEKDKNKNPLGAYLTDEVYNKGIEIFATKQEFFSEDSSLFDETLKTFVESHFKLTMLLSQNNKKMAIIYYNKENTTKRLLIIGSKVIKDADQIYDLKVFTDRVEVSKRGNNQTIPIYLRGR